MKRSVAVAMLGLACLTACGSSSASTTSTKGSGRVSVSIEHSRFALDRSDFSQGDTVTFVIRNDDPIDHEFIIGAEPVHARHEEGRQRHHHGRVPGEISVPAGTTRTTTFTFAAEGAVEYACHLPGHYDYGMRGAVSVERISVT
jgi:uncharacterized cupredoxin-like copper-binding protein